MKRCLRNTVAAVLLFAGGVFSASAQTDVDPIINFGIAEPEGGIIKSWTPGVSIKPGSSTVVQNGPFGAKALKFDGSAAAVSSFDLGPKGDALRKARDISISFAIRLDDLDAVCDTGLGMKLNKGKIAFGNDSYSLSASVTLEKDKWYQIAYTHSLDRREAKLYVNGILDRSLFNADLKPLNLQFNQFGAFNGALASMQVWNRALSDKEILRVENDGTGLAALRNRLEEAEKHVRQEPLKEFLAEVRKQIGQARNQQRIQITEQERVTRLGFTAWELAKNEQFIRDTTIGKAPFALMQVQATSKHKRRPDVFPEDAVFTANLCVAAAKGEYESFSFIIHPYKPVKDFTVTVSDFKSSKGDTLPASILDRKIVKNWYQADWNSQHNSANQVLVPDLLVNDDKLIKVDEINGKNYLRVGDKYIDVNTSAASEAFNYCKEDVRDAATLQNVDLTPGRGTQFWFTVAIPKDAKPGLYTAKATATGNGTELGTFRVTLRVYPFELPDPKVNYDRSKDFIVVLSGGADLSRYAALADAATAEKFFRAELENQKKHNILHPALPYMKDAALFEKDLKIRKELGFSLKYAVVAGVPDDGTLMNFLPVPGAKPSIDLATFKSKADQVTDLMNKAGAKDFFFYGVYDPEFRKYVFSKQGRVMTYGSGDEHFFLPSVEILHAQPYALDDYLAEKVHAMNAKLISCGYLFAGPDNPDLMRRTFGVDLYRKNYDGFFMPAYPAAANCWDERRQTGLYRNQTLCYPTQTGPINTLAYAGVREAIDDVRYITLMRMLLDEAYKIKNWDAIYAGKKAVSVFELFDTTSMDLDLMRMELADHIVTIMKRLGKDID